MKGLLSIWSCIFFYELRIYFRHSFAWLYPLGFFVIVLSLFPLALTPDPRLLQALAPGAVWIAALLASLLSLEHIFLSEIEENHLEQLVLSRYPLAWLLIAKAAAHWLASQLPLILLVPVMGALFHFTINTLLVLMISLILGTPILTLIGMLGVALTRELRYQGALLGFLILPLLIPVLVMGVSAVQQQAAGLSVAGQMAFLAGLLILAVTGLPMLVAVAVRLGVEA